MNLNYFKPGNLLVIMILAIVAQFVFGGVKNFLSAAPTQPGDGS